VRAVNLLPREVARQRKPVFGPQNAPVLVGAGLGFVVAAALGIGYVHESGAVSSAQSQLEAAKAQLAATPRPAQPSAQHAQSNAELSSQQAALKSAVSTALGGRVAWDRILREFSLVLPGDVWLSTLTLTMPPTVTSVVPTTSTTPTGLSITGSTYSHDSVARLLARLALIPELKNVTLQSDTVAGAPVAGATPSASSGSAAGGTTPAGLVTFTIVADIVLPPGAASVAAPIAPPVAPSSGTTTTTGASG
jgi:Tfp pilus assembly protein PilN